MVKKVHLFAGLLAILTIITFFISTVFSELFSSYQTIATVKSLIVVPGLSVLVPAIIVTGGSGFMLSRTWQGQLVEIKKKRMPFIAANGLLVLIPCAIFLDSLASAGLFNKTFYWVQGVELVAGFVNIMLMGMNIRDGLKMGSSSRAS
jgi:uncharacterized SAM-binding protein YcdF (DUF218 family)